MQTKPETEVGALSGARQVPLLRRDQIIPGALIVGIATDFAHEVISTEGDLVVVQRLPRNPLEPGHAHAYTQHNNTTCRCGLGRRPLATSLLPEDTTTPRWFVLTPSGPLVVPEPYSLYLLPGGRVLPVMPERGASAPTTQAGLDVPLVLRAHRIWSLPQAMQRLLEDAPSAVIDAD